MFFHVDTEVGVTIRTRARAFELGLGAGAGILGCQHPDSDGCSESLPRWRRRLSSCRRSPVTGFARRRRRFRSSRAPRLLAVNTGTTCWGNPCTGRATLFLLGLDVGFGRAPCAPAAARALTRGRPPRAYNPHVARLIAVLVAAAAVFAGPVAAADTGSGAMKVEVVGFALHRRHRFRFRRDAATAGARSVGSRRLMRVVLADALPAARLVMV